MVFRLELDHLAIAAPDLVSGAAYVRDRLGVDIPPGGSHPKMGTHNRLMRLGDTEFLEVIAIDPDAQPPEQPRWYALDRQGDRPPFLSTWILRTDDLDAACAALPRAIGRPMTVSRGDLTWRITVPDDGSMPFEGTFPTIMQWPDGRTPGATMAERDCRLSKLTVTHPLADRIEAALAPHFADDRVLFRTGHASGLQAEIETPEGSRVLGG
ncbi:VOC family protein [Notoacmeibacter marinus]|uniref:VOC family protein n=1 Tax=Notoacmeibacter marinus TaxID=1876515 RepID=UPI000DF375E2|nr:VOC family protein [Notoacmeibacter marinus]